MKLVNNWKRVLRYAWSIRLILLASALSAVEVGVQIVIDDPPINRGIFATLAALVSMLAAIVRLIAQNEVSGGKNEQA